MAPVAPSARDADTLVVGGGPAGLSAALCLARYNRRVLVFDTGHGRSTHHQVNRNYLGFPGGIPTVELRELGRAQLAGYPQARVVHHAVLHAEGDAERGFTVYAQSGSWTGRTLIIATGVLDHFPHFHGWESYVGRSMFWCIACDGYENRGKRILVVGHTDATAAEALQMHSLSDDIQLLTNSRTDEIGSLHRERLEAAGIPVLHDRIRSVEGEDGMLHTVVTRGGQHLKADSLFSIQGATPEIALARALSLRLAPSGHIAVDTEQKTSAEGIYAAGDVSSLHSHQVSAAVHEGSQAASAANYFLYPAELKAG
ncbi:NAD(P)/FAD-dependent oxidoreductase [Streptomyces sp. NBC_01236]|uniref:NAD(P)/FAD-dependent oxidoreductase n=1 Tax=Streptomyces sp. NBC_01236 TaxID=2903789 RepID=UPI002E0DC06C|nr:NAD(P)/FAD-dependent oxidoreductase [Streptomyces sp. NBC_01236]